MRGSQGKIFYYGREKVTNRNDLNANGLYTTILSYALRQIDAYCTSIGSNFVVVIDEHLARKELLETAAKTMYGANPTYRLSSPPFEVESYLNQNIQMADWMASIIGRLWNYKLSPSEFSEYEPYTRYFWDRLHAAATHSTVMECKKPVAKKHIVLAEQVTTTVTVEATTILAADDGQ